MMKRERPPSTTSSRQRGSILIYILIAIFLTGLLIAQMTQGAKKSASSEQLNEMMLYLQNDTKTIQANISECVQTYSKPVDVNNNGTADATDDPNQPFPLYHDSSFGGAGDPLTTIKCPGAPTAQQTIFTDAITNNIKLLTDTSNYTTTYFNNAAKGVFIRVTRALADPIWTEAITRLSTKYPSTYTLTTNNPDSTTAYDCSNGCLYFWILQR